MAKPEESLPKTKKIFHFIVFQQSRGGRRIPRREAHRSLRNADQPMLDRITSSVKSGRGMGTKEWIHEKFLCPRFFRVVTYCFMSKHFHLLIEEPEREAKPSVTVCATWQPERYWALRVS